MWQKGYLPRLHLGRWYFKTHIVWIVLYLVWLAFLLQLGNWQLNRAAYKQSIEMRWSHNAPPISDQYLAGNSSDLASMFYQKIAVTGDFVAQPLLYLDNRTYNGQPGYWIFQFFRLSNLDNTGIWVNRGWIGLTSNRDVLPNVSVLSGHASLEGRLLPLPSSGIQLGKYTVESFDNGRIRLQSLTLDLLGKYHDNTVLAGIINLTSDTKDNLVRDWQPVSRMTSDTHRGYAFQWFALALALTSIFIVTQMRRVTERGFEK